MNLRSVREILALAQEICKGGPRPDHRIKARNKERGRKMKKLTLREAWNILHGPTGKAHTPENKAAWDVINRFGIYGDSLEEMENGERYEAEMGAEIGPWAQD
jgi:hypothetical protein